MMNRRFLYMVLNNYMHAPSSWYTLHRIDPSLLFYPTAPSRAPQQAAAAEDARLPEPSMSFYPPHSNRDAGSMEFALLGRDKDQILAVDHKGCAVLYDDASRAVRKLPGMAPAPPDWWPGLPVAVGGEDRAFLMDAAPLADQSVEALVFDKKQQHVAAAMSEGDEVEEDWQWRSLPAPPFEHRTGFNVNNDGGSTISCHATEYGDDGTAPRVWVSTLGRGTYWLDTAGGAWSKAGDWALPFWGRAEPVFPDVWFGVSAANLGEICACDLAAAAREGRPPGPDMAWDGFGVPEGFRGLDSHSYLFHLGGRRFCVAKAFQSTRRKECAERSMCFCCCHNEYVGECTFAMFTGVEVDASWHRVAKHRSIQYSLGSDMFPVCVL